MVGGKVEDGRDLPLRLPVPDERAVSARAEGESEGVEEDGFAGARLAGQDAQSRRETQIEPVDQDDVADRKLRQHARPS